MVAGKGSEGMGGATVADSCRQLKKHSSNGSGTVDEFSLSSLCVLCVLYISLWRRGLVEDLCLLSSSVHTIFAFLCFALVRSPPHFIHDTTPTLSPPDHRILVDGVGERTRAVMLGSPRDQLPTHQ